MPRQQISFLSCFCRDNIFKINLNILTEAHKFSWFKSMVLSLRSITQGCNLLSVNPGRITRKQNIFGYCRIFVSDCVCDFKEWGFFKNILTEIMLVVLHGIHCQVSSPHLLMYWSRHRTSFLRCYWFWAYM